MAKNGYRLCLCCMEDWTYSPDQSHCPACRIEHDLHRRAEAPWNGEPAWSGWIGPTINEVNPEDIPEDGFYISSIADGDSELHLGLEVGDDER